LFLRGKKGWETFPFLYKWKIKVKRFHHLS
jgi:hypothetical protein